ncbi:MAG TPA: hypothetical protein VGH89_23000 [Pseudonocardia sp.]|jgi:hypothetical protein
MSERSQIAIVWWSLVLATIYGLALGFLLHMIGPPSATWSANEIARFYAENRISVRIGATIASWTSMFMLPLWAVIAAQIRRQEKGTPIWTIMAATGGSLMGLFLALPPLFFGVAAFTPTRAPEITATMHELGLLTLVTTDQVYIFNWAAVVVICLVPQVAPFSPFPRWYGYFSAFCGVAFEVGAFAFNFRTGPFSWNGLIVFWMPLTLFGVWILVSSVLLLKALKAQRLAAETRIAEPALA